MITLINLGQLNKFLNEVIVMHNKQTTRNYSLCFLIIAMFLNPILGPFSGIFAQTQNKCEEDLKEANDKFLDFEIEDALKLVKNCLDKKDITTVDKVLAHLLGGKIYFLNSDTVTAMKEFILVFESDSTFKPSLESESPEEIALLKIAKSEFQRQQRAAETPPWGGDKKWIWIAAGGAAVGAAIILRRDGDDQRGFPGPPGRPNR